MSGNAAGLNVGFDLGSGSTMRAATAAWGAGNKVGVTGCGQRRRGSTARAFYVTGVKLEIGSVATPYNRQSLAKSMADCQRYFQVYNPIFVGGFTPAAGQPFYTPVLFSVPMRATPTIAFSGQTYSNASAIAVAVPGNNALTVLQASLTATTNSGWAQALATFSAEL